ncbi:xanthine dehydrogenase family protein molybdopterin-binding subunit [Olivibacter sp. SDN3]|uniref:xanthine dehydrogenase family protein molybdopterin-binding subunit n=1 Tax=Olivibacter sp. SDN3 TaxID=2764720 RepID=UPI001650D8B6|nr:molybdopterin cofactor-binding domain-containing protein [Olivibacter sp. SDN3]QNL51888.1 xanthine dehydrogenase family protein molybdopterin-binding subunit [Olivibacter sp. SDN3]
MATEKERTSISRRNFLKATGIGAGTLCLGYLLPASARIVNMTAPGNADVATTVSLNAWIHIGTDGKVTLFDHRAEMGQGSYHSVPQIIAEELEVDLKDIVVEFAPGDRKKYGGQITGGSSTIRGSYKQLLNLSATARMMLVQAAANEWSVDVADCYAEAGHVIHRSSGKKLNYGALVTAASQLQAPEEVDLKPMSEYKLIRKPLRRIDTPLKTNGAAVFGLDKRIPDMRFATVVRNPRMRGTVKSFDDAEAMKVKGVERVFKVRMKVFNTWREGVAIVANSTWAALQAKKKLKVEWDDSGFEHVNTADIYQRQKELLAGEEGLTYHMQGDPSGIIASAGSKLDVVYETPYQSHYAMEPVNCIAHWKGDTVEVWGPIQAPELVQDAIAEEFGIPWEQVKVNMTFLGGGFGRKAFMDYPFEAVMVSKVVGGPVQVVWTREDDATQGPYRPGISYRCEGVVDGEKIGAMKVRLCGQNIGHFSSDDRSKANGSSSEGFLEPYLKAIPAISIADVPFELPIPVLWWRSVYASTNGFAYESFIDELAVAAGSDPMQFRRAHLPEERVHQLIDKLEELSGWKSRRPNEGYGVAITECFDSTVGQVVKVSRKPEGGIKIDQVWVVMDCGWFVNPDIIHAQIEGSVIMGLGAATMHEITFTDGLVNEKNFYDYKIPRIMDMPLIESHIMENAENAGGVGEPALPPFAPALANAVFDLTGKRIRRLPFDMTKV